MSRPQYSFPSSGNFIPEDKDQRLLQTPFGKGLVLRTRKSETGGINVLREIELLDWKQPASKSGPIRPAMLYSPVDFPSVPFTVGDDVLTIYGRGSVIEDNGGDQVVVLLSSWRLAGRSRVKCYLKRKDVQLVRPKKLWEMSVYEKVEHAQNLKDVATEQFKAKDYVEALVTFSKAIDAVKYVQHSPHSSNEVRADLLVLMIACSNNAGTCCTQLRRWDDVINFAKNAMALIDALEEKKGLKIHTLLNKEGFHDIKLFGEWRVKSCLLLATALLEKGEAELAMDLLKTAHEVISKFLTDEYIQQPELKASVKNLQANDKEVKKRHAAGKELRKAHLKKEKLRAQAMFGGGSPAKKDEEKKETSPGPVDESQRKENVSFATSTSPETAPASGSTPAAKSTESSNTPVKQASEDHDHGFRTRKRVSFAEDVKDNQTESTTDYSDELEWYQDTEVLTGLAIFGGTVIATVAGLTYLLSRKR